MGIREEEEGLMRILTEEHPHTEHLVLHSPPPAGMMRYMRATAPADYTLRIEGFTFLLPGECFYHSVLFESGGYKWRFVLYPGGDKKRNGEGFISLYLQLIDQEDTLPVGLELNVQFRFFLYDQIRDNYLTVQDANGGIRRFHKMNPEHGFPQFISLSTFKDSSNGYLLDNTCVFGVELFVMRNTAFGESLSATKDNVCFFLIIPKFSTKDCHTSRKLSYGRKNWFLKFYPKGDEKHKGTYLSLYLCLAEEKPTPSTSRYANFMRSIRGDNDESEKRNSNQEGGVYVVCHLRVLDPMNCCYIQRTVNQWFNKNCNSGGFGDFLPLDSITNESNSLLVNDLLKVEAHFIAVLQVENYC